MKPVAPPIIAVTLAVLAAFSSPRLLLAQEARLRQYDVVPPAWITPDGDPGHTGESSDQERSRAFVFPSLAPTGSVTLPLKVEIRDFFRQNNRFHEKVFVWSGGQGSNEVIEIHIARNEEDASVEIDPLSMSRVRKLDWEPFSRLQMAFLNWLFKHSNCGWFGNCEDRFSEHFHHNLTTLWKDNVLKDATFDRFSATYLNTTSAVKIQYSGNVGGIEKPQTTMFVTQIEPRQQLVVTWGNDNLYPARTGITDSYSRTTSGGRTELQVVSDHGMRLYPLGSCVVQSTGENANSEAPDGILLPYPIKWAGLIGTEFVPVYNLFDLHNNLLLTSGSPPASGILPDCPDNTREAPRYMFLFTPASYVKADAGPRQQDIAQFENEARPGPHASPRDDLNMLARQFVIVGCNSASTGDVNDEWNHLLEIAFSNLPGAPSVNPVPGKCGGFVHGIFSGKSFVELRNHFSVNGRPIENGAINLASVGQALATSFAAHLNLESAPGSQPLVELFRTPDPEKNSLLAGKLRIRFHTTMSKVLDQVDIFEGDEIYAGSISEVLR